MVALSFQKQFRALLLTRVKRHTLRNPWRRGGPVEGVALQLYTGMRTRYCSKIGDAMCLGVVGIRLDFANDRIDYESGATHYTTALQLDGFAVSDGFADWAALREFWRIKHPDAPHAWQGNKIFWGNTLQAACETSIGGA